MTTMTVRMLPRNGVTATGWAGPGDPGGISSRRYYTAPAGGTVDVFATDANALGSQGMFAVGNGSGPTSARPNGVGGVNIGFLYLDTTLNLFVVWNGQAGWINPITGAGA